MFLLLSSFKFTINKNTNDKIKSYKYKIYLSFRSIAPSSEKLFKCKTNIGFLAKQKQRRKKQYNDVVLTLYVKYVTTS